MTSPLLTCHPMPKICLNAPMCQSWVITKAGQFVDGGCMLLCLVLLRESHTFWVCVCSPERFKFGCRMYFAGGVLVLILARVYFCSCCLWHLLIKGILDIVSHRAMICSVLSFVSSAIPFLSCAALSSSVDALPSCYINCLA